MALLLLVLAVLPGLLISWFIYRKDKYQREQPVHLLQCFVLGMLITLPVMQLEQWAHDRGYYETASPGLILLASFVLVAGSEELVKFLALTLYPYRQPFFNEPIDGIIYAVIIAMGFATLENVLYAMRYGIETTVMRAFTAVPAHAAFGVIMGYFVGRSKFVARGRRWRLGLALLVPVAIHGAYNFVILQEAWDGLLLLTAPILALSIYLALRLIRIQQERSPFKPGADEGLSEGET